MSASPEQPGAVVVVGSLHYDIMVDAPDRPRKGETVAGYRWRPKFGGKGGNQAVAAARAGAVTRMVGAVGADDFGAFLLNGLDAAGVDRSHVCVLEGTASGMSVAISDDDGDYGAVIVSGSNLQIPESSLDAEDLWRDARVLLLQNETGEEINTAAARRAHAAGVLVCLNAAPARPLGPELVDLVDVLIVNGVEAEMLSGIVVDTIEDALRAAVELRRRHRNVVVTAGGAGVAAAVEDRTISAPAVPVEVVSTHGAGDTFVGVFGAALAAGARSKTPSLKANRAAAAHVGGQAASGRSDDDLIECSIFIARQLPQAVEPPRRPPRVSMPRALSSVAIALRLVAPKPQMSATTGARSWACRSALRAMAARSGAPPRPARLSAAAPWGCRAAHRGSWPRPAPPWCAWRSPRARPAPPAP